MRLGRDAVVGVAALALAGIYYYFSRDIQQSLLSDAVGAQGLPQLYALALAALALILLAQAGVRPRRADEMAPTSREEMLDHARAVGLLLLGVAYLALIAALGYLATVFLLLVAVALYAGARLRPRLVAIAAIGAVLLWAIFVKLFALTLPSGELWQRFGN